MLLNDSILAALRQNERRQTTATCFYAVSGTVATECKGLYRLLCAGLQHLCQNLRQTMQSQLSKLSYELQKMAFSYVYPEFYQIVGTAIAIVAPIG